MPGNKLISKTPQEKKVSKLIAIFGIFAMSLMGAYINLVLGWGLELKSGFWFLVGGFLIPAMCGITMGVVVNEKD